MLCYKPFFRGSQQCPCGTCGPCRIARRKVWAHRILLETFKHGDSCFVTLTYSDKFVPDSLVRSHYQDWLKRLRRSLSPRKIRFFLAGEYGDISGRPHFHVALFGVDSVTLGGSDGRSGLAQECWYVDKSKRESLGFTFVGELNWKSACYIAGYVTKKMRDDNARAYCRMSLRPGIGAVAIGDIARALDNDSAKTWIASNGDVPAVLQHDKRILPLGRYLRRKLREEMGKPSDTPAEFQRLFSVRQAAQKLAERDGYRSKGFKPWEIDKIVRDNAKQKCINLEAKARISGETRRLI